MDVDGGKKYWIFFHPQTITQSVSSKEDRLQCRPTTDNERVRRTIDHPPDFHESSEEDMGKVCAADYDPWCEIHKRSEWQQVHKVSALQETLALV